MMTLEEACLYLNINPDDDDINLEQLEKNYNDKLKIYDSSKFKAGSPEYLEAEKKRAEIEEACNYLLDVYSELHPDINNHEANKPHRNYFTLAALLTAGIITICSLAGTAYFIHVYQSEKSEKERITKTFTETLSESEAMHQEKYDSLRKEIEALKAKTDEVSAAQAAQEKNNNKQERLIKELMPSMVYIKTDGGQGSGFFVSSAGDILTNYHVIDNAGEINITTNDNKHFSALIKGYDSEKDIALLAVKSSNKFPFLRISKKLPEQGETVIAIGNPRGYKNSVSNGIVSALRQMDNNSWVQFSAPVSPGSSGGALINLNGEVVGIPTKIRTDAQNLNFAVAPDVINKFLDSAIKNPARTLNSSRVYQARTPKSQKSSRDSGIPLPDSRGFLVHKWGCSVDSIRRYVSSPLLNIGGGFYTTNKAFKAFRSKIDVKVIYYFDYGMLKAVNFLVSDYRDKSTLESRILSELTEIYGLPDINNYNNGVYSRIWGNYGISIAITYNRYKDELTVVFMKLT